MTLTFFKLYTVYTKKIRTMLFPYLLVNLFKQRYISSVKRWKKIFEQVHKLGIKTTVLTFEEYYVYFLTAVWLLHGIKTTVLTFWRILCIFF